jgi:hypothetical protein
VSDRRVEETLPPGGHDRRDPERADRRQLLVRRGGRRASDPPADWLSVTDYAARFGVDRSTVYKWLGEDLLETYRMDNILRIKNLPPDRHHPPARVAPCGPTSKL